MRVILGLLAGLAGCAEAAPRPIAIEIASSPTTPVSQFASMPNAARYIEPPIAGGSAPPFDRDAATKALQGTSLDPCSTPFLNGPGRATITFDPSGHVATVDVDQGPYTGTPIGDCIAHAYATTRIPPFSGDAVTLTKSFYLP